jgi:hypothetical protein
MDALLAEVDRCFVENADLRIEFDDETDGYDRAKRAIMQHARERGYHRTYEYWYDGCNYAGVDILKGRPIRASNGPRPGSCWMSAPWRFDEVAPPAAAAPAEPAEPAEPCCVCLDAPPETLVLPCGHSVACRACSDRLASTANARVCIVCRQPITEILADDAAAE